MIAEWFERRGFPVRGAPELKAWLEAKVAGGAYGSVVVMGMGLVPAMLVEPLDETCVLRRYMDAGGRVVWTGDTALYVAQAETGPVYSIGEAGMSSLLQHEWRELLAYHDALPAGGVDHVAATREFWDLMPTDSSPLLGPAG